MPLLSTLVRSAVLSDAPALAALGRTTFVQTFMEDFAIPYPPDDIAAYLQKNYTVEAIRNMLQEAGAMTWVAERDGALLAFANAGPNTLPSVLLFETFSRVLTSCAALIPISVTPTAVAATLSSDACELARSRTPQLHLPSQRPGRYVARSEQGQGLGRQMFALAVDWMRANSDGGGGPMWIGYAALAQASCLLIFCLTLAIAEYGAVTRGP
jgi:hypothetical protein